MFQVRVDTANFSDAIRRYAELTGKGLGLVVKEQALFLAQALTRYTYPKSASQGKKRTAIDSGRIFLSNAWFEEKFAFRKKSLGDRVVKLVRAKDEGGLRALFLNTNRLRLVRVEPFDAGNLERMRRNGRVLVPNPRSFPVAQQSQVKALQRTKAARVGMAKAGWAQAVATLGKSIPAWLSKPGLGSVSDKSREKNPSITITNSVPWAAAMDQRAGIVTRALRNRGSAMITSAKRALAQAAKDAGL